MRSLIVTMVLAVALAGDAYAETAAPPFFAAFERFCVETNSAPKAVQAAVLAAGGRQFRPWARTASWTIVISGREFRISSGVLQAPDPAGPDTLSVSCDVESFQNEDPGLAAARAWVGVPKQDASNDTSFESYAFQQWNGDRAPAPTDKAGYSAASDRGLIWQLTLTRAADVAGAQLLHILGPAPR